MKYASQTTVPSEQSKAEIEKLIKRYGADQFVSGWANNRAVIGFQMQGRFVRFHLPLPKADDPKFRQTATGRQRHKHAERAAQIDYEQEVRQRWRALLLVIKAKFEAVESGITSFQEEFLAHILMADGQTVGQWAVPQVNEMYEKGYMPPLLPGVGETGR